MQIYVSHSRQINYEDELYAPLRTLEPTHQLILPHDVTYDGMKTKDIIAQSDCVIAEVSLPATGQGIELGWADMSNVPILAVFRPSADMSGSVKYVAQSSMQYESTEELIEIIGNWLENLASK